MSPEREGFREAFLFLLEEMCGTLGAIGESDTARIREVANALGVPPPETGNRELDVLLLWEEYVRRANP